MELTVSGARDTRVSVHGVRAPAGRQRALGLALPTVLLTVDQRQVTLVVTALHQPQLA